MLLRRTLQVNDLETCVEEQVGVSGSESLQHTSRGTGAQQLTNLGWGPGTILLQEQRRDSSHHGCRHGGAALGAASAVVEVGGRDSAHTWCEDRVASAIIREAGARVRGVGG